MGIVALLYYVVSDLFGTQFNELIWNWWADVVGILLEQGPDVTLAPHQFQIGTLEGT